MNHMWFEGSWKSQFLSGIMIPLISFIGNLGYIAVAILGGWLAFQSVITVGDIQAFIQYVRLFTQPLSQIANISNVFQQTAAASERVFNFLEEKDEIDDISMPFKLNNVEGHAEFKNVQFGYNPEKIIINNFSAIVNLGKKLLLLVQQEQVKQLLSNY